MTASEFRRRLRHLPDAAGSRRVARYGFQHAAVLIPIVRLGDGYGFLFTKRTDRVETHKGQVSFPGGVIDQADADYIAAALREAEEEIDLPKESVSILGVLDDFATPTGFVITPVVGLIEELPPLTPNIEEVDEVFQVAVDFFVDQTHATSEVKRVEGIDREVWYYRTGSHTIWGATAAIIRSLLQTLQLL
jgi:8-oxo-dGTP pyrophosphatase MutT (NUDIX family)